MQAAAKAVFQWKIKLTPLATSQRAITGRDVADRRGSNLPTIDDGPAPVRNQSRVSRGGGTGIVLAVTLAELNPSIGIHRRQVDE